MKSQINPVVAVVIVVVLLLGVGLFLWKGSSGPGGTGRVESNLDFSKAEKDPAKMQSSLQDALKKEEAGKK